MGSYVLSRQKVEHCLPSQNSEAQEIAPHFIGFPNVVEAA